MRSNTTIITGAVSPDEYDHEIARRMWATVATRLDDNQTDDLRDCGLATTRELRATVARDGRD